MPNRKFKLIYLSHDLTKKVELTLSHRKVRGLLLALAVFFLATNIVAGLLASFVLNSRENEVLQAENHALRDHLSEIETRIAGLGGELRNLSETDRVLRMMADMPMVAPEVRDAGVGGSVEPVPMIDESVPEVNNVLWTLDRVQRELELQTASFAEVHSKMTADKERLKHTPTLRPITGGYVSSGFGVRRDPFTGSVENHAGLDITQQRGAPVLAAGDGQVIYAGYYSSYGKFVVIDHGFGYTTAYGHLHSYNVREGQAVSKGQQVGQVGSTGRATGTHLHYEVRVNGTAVDPSDYFFDEVAALPSGGIAKN